MSDETPVGRAQDWGGALPMVVGVGGVFVAGLIVGAIAVVLIPLRRQSEPMHWSKGPDGFEGSYVREGGPIYVRRKFVDGGCVFGDFPADGGLPLTNVSCGETWTGNLGERLLCECR
jgi:hypothetical protein